MPGAVTECSYPHLKEKSNAPGLLGGSGSCGTKKHVTSTPGLVDEVKRDAQNARGLHQETDYVR